MGGQFDEFAARSGLDLVIKYHGLLDSMGANGAAHSIAMMLAAIGYMKERLGDNLGNIAARGVLEAAVGTRMYQDGDLQ